MWLLYSSYKTPACGNLTSPGQILPPFIEELDGLLSSFPKDDSPILVFGDFNMYLDKPLLQTSIHSLLIWSHMPYHYKHAKSGNQLDLN